MEQPCVQPPNFLKLNCSSAGYPYVLSGALPRGYFTRFFNGKPLPDSWTPPPVEIRRAKAKLPDAIAWKEHLALLSKRAVDLFEETAPGCAEYREFLSIRGSPYYVLNVLTTENILDLENSEFTRSANGDIRTVQRYFFTVERTSSPLFKLSNRLDGPVFLTHAFARAIVDAGLLGFEFRNPALNETRMLFSGASANYFPG